MYQKSIFVFLDIAKNADIQWKNAHVSRTQVVCHMIHIAALKRPILNKVTVMNIMYDGILDIKLV